MLTLCCGAQLKPLGGMWRLLCFFREGMIRSAQRVVGEVFSNFVFAARKEVSNHSCSLQGWITELDKHACIVSSSSAKNCPGSHSCQFDHLACFSSGPLSASPALREWSVNALVGGGGDHVTRQSASLLPIRRESNVDLFECRFLVNPS